MTLVYLIRHGENDLVGKKLAGRMPGVHLNKRGRRQAESIVGRLAGIPITGVFSSPLERAIETAEPLANVHGLSVQVSQGLLEMDYASWQGKTFPQLRRLKSWKTVQEAPHTFRFPGGESFREAQTRASTEIMRISSVCGPDECAACFSHADIIRLALANFLNMQLKDFQRLVIHTASISALSFESGAVRVIYINRTSS
jgi:probable phosphomutase (TIGR03848 family)